MRPLNNALDVWTEILCRRAVLDTAIYLPQECDRQLILDCLQEWLDSGFVFTNEWIENMVEGKLPQLRGHTILAGALRRGFAKQYDFGMISKSAGTEKNERTVRRKRVFKKAS